ncbi:MAG: tRNA adenosine(34) deaminase TadA [Candidatus Neptunochlamydia sp.]|nr:tRNA adenosine(34) deaminase TadA [Candidatus Neptunochlamydia sp.]
MGKKKFSKFDHEMMGEALFEAKKSFEKEEVPVGAILVHNQKIIARSHNQMEQLKDPSAHAEVLAIRAGAETIGDWRLLQTTLYITLEPCLMCAGAILLARVGSVVWGAPDLRHGAHGSYINVFESEHPTHALQIEGGLLKEESVTLMREFFKIQRIKR